MRRCGKAVRLVSMGRTSLPALSCHRGTQRTV